MYTLQLLNLPWTEAQEKTVSKEFPFVDVYEESPELSVVRTYLQFLWLPESIMPLNRFVPCIMRVDCASSSSPTSPHPLHALLEPLLRTARSAALKYQVELPKVLSGMNDPNESDEMEETMMWYAFHHDKTEPDARGQSNKPWLERMEHREALIQILLHFLLLSLPGPLPPTAAPPSELSSVQRRKYSLRKDTPKAPSIADRLETLMDKLSTWQLVGSLEAVVDPQKKELDWMQLFSRDVVDPEFKSKLPATCALLHAKVFPKSALAECRSPSPPLQLPKKKRAKPLTSSQPERYGASALHATGDPRSLARSRSLSVSLALEEEQMRARSANNAAKKRVISREVSMSRILKPKQPPKKAPSLSVVPEKPKETNKAKDEGVVLVEATPAKVRVAAPRNPKPALVSKKPLLPPKEEDWHISSSPIITSLSMDDDDDDDPQLLETPTKRHRHP